MIQISYTLDEVEGDSGPNLSLEGVRSDFALLAADLRTLVTDKLVELNSKQLPYIEEVNVGLSIEVCEREKQLSKLLGDTVYMRLDVIYIQALECMAETLSKRMGHIYVDFDYMNMYQECNLIFICKG